MKIGRLALAMSALFVGLFLVNTAWALSATTLKVEIPFAFYAAEKQLPAGQYFITQKDGGHTLTMRQVDGPEYATVVVMPQSKAASKQKDTLVFHQYGSEYFLHSVAAVNSPIGGFLPKSKREGNLASELVRKQGKDAIAQVTLGGNAE